MLESEVWFSHQIYNTSDSCRNDIILELFLAADINPDFDKNLSNLCEYFYMQNITGYKANSHYKL